MHVRRAQETDARGIGEVHVLTWQTSYRGLVPDSYLDALAIEPRAEHWQRALAEADPQQPVWVSTHAGQVAGFANAGPSRDQDADRDVGELYAIYVRPRDQGKGIGQALITEANAWLADRYNTATLWVLENNDRSRRFYELGGWTHDGTRKTDDRGDFVLVEARYRIDFASELEGD